jgi:hypothetical protein
MDLKIADSFNYRQIRPVNKRFLDRARNKQHGFDLVGKRAKYGVSQIRSHIRMGLWRSVKELFSPLVPGVLPENACSSGSSPHILGFTFEPRVMTSSRGEVSPAAEIPAQGIANHERRSLSACVPRQGARERETNLSRI